MADLAALKIVLSAEGGEKVVKDISAIRASSDATNTVLVGLNNTLKKIERSGLAGLRSEFDKTRTASAQLSDQVKKQEAIIANLQAQISKLSTTQVSSTAATNSGTAAVANHRKGLQNLIPHVAAVTISYMAMRKAVKAVMDILKTGTDFEQQMAIVSGIVRATATEFETLSAAARKAGEETVWTATEAANALRFLVMAGFIPKNLLPL